VDSTGGRRPSTTGTFAGSTLASGSYC
ncbi:hypothetical protein AVDCRST_MAG94-744, partial [uncultured Leptolyngbya sp.]